MTLLLAVIIVHFSEFFTLVAKLKKNKQRRRVKKMFSSIFYGFLNAKIFIDKGFKKSTVFDWLLVV